MSHVELTHTAPGGFNEFAVAFPHLVEIEEAVPVQPLAALKTLHVPRDSPAKVKITNLEPTQILPGLYIGARKDALNRDTLAALGIRSIVNVTKDVPNAFPEDIDYVQIPVDVCRAPAPPPRAHRPQDHWSQDLSCYFDLACDFIDSHRKCVARGAAALC